MPISEKVKNAHCTQHVGHVPKEGLCSPLRQKKADNTENLSLEGTPITPEKLAILERHQRQQQKQSEEAQQLLYESLGAKLGANERSENPTEPPKEKVSSVTPKKPKQRKSCSRWTAEEDEKLTEAIRLMGARNWNEIAKFVGTKNGDQCNQHWHRVLNPKISRTPWTKEEDQMLIAMVDLHGQSSWKKVAEFVSGRTDIQCRHRWIMLKRQAERAARPPVAKLRKKKLSSGLKDKRKRSMSDVLPRTASQKANAENKLLVKKRYRAHSSAKLPKRKDEVVTPREFMEECLFDQVEDFASDGDQSSTRADSTPSFEFEMFVVDEQAAAVSQEFMRISAPLSIHQDKTYLTQETNPSLENDNFRAQFSKIYDETLDGVHSPVQAFSYLESYDQATISGDTNSAMEISLDRIDDIRSSVLDSESSLASTLLKRPLEEHSSLHAMSDEMSFREMFDGPVENFGNSSSCVQRFFH